MTMLYFAYGSNMLGERLRQADRAPSARAHCRAWLVGHQLEFHKRGRDGSGKCDAHQTGSTTTAVHGVAYRIDPAERESLERIEACGQGYAGRVVGLMTGAGALDAYTYLARPEFIDAVLRPFDWYLELVIAGAREHRLPAAYIRALEAVVAGVDPDHRRAARERRALPA